MALSCFAFLVCVWNVAWRAESLFDVSWICARIIHDMHDDQLLMLMTDDWLEQSKETIKENQILMFESSTSRTA